VAGFPGLGGSFHVEWVAGFSGIHTGVANEARQRKKLECLCRYISRPAVSEKRLAAKVAQKLEDEYNVLLPPNFEIVPHKVVTKFMLKRRLCPGQCCQVL